MKSCVFAALSLQLFSCAVAQTCDHQYDTVSAACCEGAPSRRLADGAGLLDIGVCTLPSSCKPACAKVYSAFYKKCGQSMMLTGAKYSQYVTTCKIGSASVGGFKKLRARCNVNYQQNARFPAGTTRAAATKMCAKNSTCAGVYVTSCASNTSALYMCLPNLYFQPSTYACVLANPKMALVAPPTDACLSSPCQHGGTCRSYISGATSRYSCNCPHASTSNLASTAASAYFGAHCESKWVNTCASNPCQNGATCRPSTYTSSYSCSCAKDTTAAVLYGGTNCGTQFVDPCKSAPCMNGGTCQSSASTYSKTASYYCRCATGYLGNACDMQRAPPAATCKSSKLQTCKMLCNNGPQCKPGQCLMHTDSCCGRECRALTCSEDDCCYSKTNNYCACKGSKSCKGTTCLVGAPAGTCGPKTGSCTAAQTKAGKKWTACGTACPKVCGRAGGYCSMQCVLGCQCPSGQYYDGKMDKCVALAKCSSAPPPPYMDGPMDGMMMDGGFGGGIGPMDGGMMAGGR